MLRQKLSHSKVLTWLTTGLSICAMSMMLLSTPVSAASWNPNVETAPGYNKCMNQATTDFEMSDCNWQSVEALEKQISNAYKKINAICNKLTQDDATPEEMAKGVNVKKKCLQTVKAEQAAWNKFYKLALQYAPFASPNRGGTAERVDTSSMILKMVRDHYDTIVFETRTE